MEEEHYNYTEAYRQFGNEKYLADDETLEQVIAQDAEILKHHGVSQEEIAHSLRRLFSTFNDFLAHRSPGPQEPMKGIRLWKYVFDLGVEYCPYLAGVYSNTDWLVWVEGLQNGNKGYHPKNGPTNVSDMLPAMIEKMGFFEGKIFYGIKLEWAIAVHNLVRDVPLTSYVPRYEKRAWSSCNSFFLSWEEEKGLLSKAVDRVLFLWYNNRLYSNGRIYTPDWVRERQDLLEIPKLVMRKAIYKERVSPAIISYVAPGDLDLSNLKYNFRFKRFDTERTRNPEFWGLLIGEEKSILSPDALLMGLPIDKYVSHFNKGDIELLHLTTSFDKIVG